MYHLLQITEIDWDFEKCYFYPTMVTDGMDYHVCGTMVTDGMDYHVCGTMVTDGMDYHVCGTMVTDGMDYHVCGTMITDGMMFVTLFQPTCKVFHCNYFHSL